LGYITGASATPVAAGVITGLFALLATVIAAIDRGFQLQEYSKALAAAAVAGSTVPVPSPEPKYGIYSFLEPV
jgi:3-oxoacyl-ACP reductase-like protein